MDTPTHELPKKSTLCPWCGVGEALIVTRGIKICSSCAAQNMKVHSDL